MKDNTAYPGGYEVTFKRGIMSGDKAHIVQVTYGDCTIGASGEDLSTAFRNLADRLDSELNGGPMAKVVWGSDSEPDASFDFIEEIDYAMDCVQRDQYDDAVEFIRKARDSVDDEDIRSNLLNALSHCHNDRGTESLVSITNARDLYRNRNS